MPPLKGAYLFHGNALLVATLLIMKSHSRFIEDEEHCNKLLLKETRNRADSDTVSGDRQLNLLPLSLISECQPSLSEIRFPNDTSTEQNEICDKEKRVFSLCGQYEQYSTLPLIASHKRSKS